MAIVKAVNSKGSTPASLNEKINYCCNPHKIGSVEPAVVGISSDPFKAFKVNKLLHGKIHCQRLHKEYIISMKATWPQAINAFREYERLMDRLTWAALLWWAEKGFQVLGAIHCNTAHPHIHILVDTCNTQSGDQLSQPLGMLAEIKDYLSNTMESLGMGEVVLQQIEVSEEEMQAEDDMEYSGFPDFGEEDAVNYEYLDDAGMEFEDTTDFDVARIPPRETYIVPLQFFGLLEEGDRERHYRSLARSVNNSAGRVMCKKVDNSGGREMCNIADKPSGTMEHWNGR